MPRGDAGGGGDGNGNGDEGDGNDDDDNNDFGPDLQERDVESESDPDSDDESEDEDEDPEKGEDLGQRELRECDRRLMEVYGDTLHSSNGCGLHGGGGMQRMVLQSIGHAGFTPQPHVFTTAGEDREALHKTPGEGVQEGTCAGV